MANWITLSRFPGLLAFVLMLYFGSPAVRLASVPFLFFLLMLDTVDGAVARARGQTSLMGSVLDIAADRTYELVLWVALANLALIPVAIPLIVIGRTTLTDALRSIGISQGKRPFDQHRSRLGRFLVASPWMRSSYSIAKITAFCGLTLGLALAGYPPESGAHRAAPVLLELFGLAAWVATGLCVVRGLPVIVSAARRGLGSAKDPSGSGAP
ncbi:MAG: CDP-alcohol phosphatidyltransferase family protein [Chloroflexota bacterium]